MMGIVYLEDSIKPACCVLRMGLAGFDLTWPKWAGWLAGSTYSAGSIETNPARLKDSVSGWTNGVGG